MGKMCIYHSGMKTACKILAHNLNNSLEHEDKYVLNELSQS